jgi:hypothetical protein
MSRRIACLALAAATLIAAPAFGAQQHRDGVSRHLSKHAYQRHGMHDRRKAHHHGHKRLRHVRRFGSLVDSVAVVGVPAAHHSSVILANPWPLSDPSWKLCQLDPGLDGRPDLCGPYSYYPFGAYGYRPYGTYRPDAERTYARVPGAKVIRVPRAD